MSCFQAFSSLCYILSIFLSPLLDFQVQCIGGPKKHIVLGDSCSAACQAVNDALRHFQVLQASVFVDGFTCFDLFEPLNAFDGNAVFNASIGDWLQHGTTCAKITFAREVGSGCVSVSLSDSARYPYFTRMAPSFRFNVPCHR